MKTLTKLRYFYLLAPMVMLAVLNTGDSIRAQKDETDKASVPVETLDKAVKSGRIKQESVDSAAKAGGAAVIVKVRLPRAFRPIGDLTSGELDRQQADIRVAQAAVLKAIAGTKFSDVKRFRFIPWMALTGDTASLLALVRSKDVLRVRVDEELKPALATSVPLIGGDRVRAATGSAGAGQTVAILDTGVDKTHPFLAGRVVSEACFSTSNPFIGARNVCPSANDSAVSGGGPCGLFDCFHGTAVAGIAAGRANAAAGLPFSGVAPEASIIAIQVFSEKHSFPAAPPLPPVDRCAPEPSPCLRALDSDVIEGLEHVLTLRNRFRIAAVNLSLGSNSYTNQSDCDGDQDDYRDAIDNLRSVGIATVAGSGNLPPGGSFFLGVAKPACVSSAISVGATIPPPHAGSPENVWSGSQTASFLTLLAPGVGVTTSVPPNGTSSPSGTSMAAPHVTGSIAVLQSLQPGQSVTDIINTLTGTGQPIADLRPGASTKPRVQLDAAVEAQNRAPLRPSNLRVTNVTGRTITVAWNDNSRSEIRFEVTSNTTVNPRLLPSPINPSPGANTTVATFTRLIPNTEYALRIRACDAVRCSTDTDPIFRRTLNPAPPPPTGLRIENVTSSGFTARWNLDPANPVTSYRLSESLSGLVCTGIGGTPPCSQSNSNWTPGRDIVGSPPAQSFTRGNLAGNWSFHWRLQACIAGDCSTVAIGPTVRAPTPGPPPAAPTNLRICSSSIAEGAICPRIGRPSLRWDDNASDEERYELEWSQAGDPRNRIWTQVPLGANHRVHAMTGLMPGGLYDFRVRACKQFVCSGYSNTFRFTVPRR